MRIAPARPMGAVADSGHSRRRYSTSRWRSPEGNIRMWHIPERTSAGDRNRAMTLLEKSEMAED